MYAVVRTGGKQYRVAPGDILEVEKLAGDVGDSIVLEDVLLVATDDGVKIGQPNVNGASVTAKITGQHRGEKILVFRYRPKKRVRVRRGHRQYLTRLEIQSIREEDLDSAAGTEVTEKATEALSAEDSVEASNVEASIANVSQNAESSSGSSDTEEKEGE